MIKCDSCGKVVVSEKDYICPHCGAVAKKHCDHKGHLPDDRFNRTGAYNTDSNNKATQHKSKTYDYERIPKTNENQNFNIDDLANIKDASDVKKIAKKAFVKQGSDGKKKFKPAVIAVIVILVVNIIGNGLDLVLDVVEDVFDEIGYAFEEMLEPSYTLGEDKITHNFYATATVDGASYDIENDCLTIDFSEVYFEYSHTQNEEYEIIERDWQDEFSKPSEYFCSGKIEPVVTAFTEKEIQDSEVALENDYETTLEAELTDSGLFKIYGLKLLTNDISKEEVYFKISGIEIVAENEKTNESFGFWLSLPTNFINIHPDYTLEFYDIYHTTEDVDKEVIDMNNQYIPFEYVDCISW